MNRSFFIQHNQLFIKLKLFIVLMLFYSLSVFSMGNQVTFEVTNNLPVDIKIKMFRNSKDVYYEIPAGQIKKIITKQHEYYVWPRILFKKGNNYDEKDSYVAYTTLEGIFEVPQNLIIDQQTLFLKNNEYKNWDYIEIDYLIDKMDKTISERKN